MRVYILGVKCKIQVLEMMYPRSVKCVSVMDRIRNLNIRRELETKQMLEYTDETQLSCYVQNVREHACEK